jgi:hypothetical protein
MSKPENPVPDGPSQHRASDAHSDAAKPATLEQSSAPSNQRAFASLNFMTQQIKHFARPGGMHPR